MKKIFFLSLILSLLLQINVGAQTKVFLKLDDFGVLKDDSHAAITMDTIIARKIKAAIGVIAKNLDADARFEYKKYMKATNDNGEPLIEIWHHGYDHSNKGLPKNNGEFNGTSYDYQLDHFGHADKDVKKVLRVQMHTFGSPGNATDSNTFKVLSEFKNYKVIFFGKGPSGMRGDLLYLNNEIKMESNTGVVNYDYFMAQYKANKDKFPDYFVMQGHPNGWDPARVAEFTRILDFLIAQHVQFVLPYEYYSSL